MIMKIVLTEKQIKTIVSEQVSFQYDDEKIKEMVGQVDTMISDTTRLIGEYMGRFIATSVGDIVESPDSYISLLEKIRNVHESIYSKYNRIDTIQVEMDDDNQLVRHLGNQLSELNLILDELDNVRSLFEDMIDMITSNGEVSNKIKRLSQFIKNIEINQ